MDTTQNVPAGLGGLAHLYRDEEQSLALREQALAGLIETYVFCAASPARGEEAGNLLAECLEPVIRRMARRVARGATHGERADFVEEALTLVLAPREGLPARICGYQTGRRLEPWLRTVLQHLWMDGRREWLRRHRLLQDFARTRPFVVVVGEGFILPESLARADLDRLAGWDRRRRVEVLCLAGLWPLIPPDSWEGWLVDYERLRNRELCRPFPPDDIKFCDQPKERLRPLAERFGYSPNTLAVRWLRSHHYLNELDFIRELTPT